MISGGDGKIYPQYSQTVTVHYDAFLEDGTQWDSSRQRGKPLRWRIGFGQVIKGLDEGVQQLSLGERVRLMVDSSWAYGARGFPGRVPPYANVTFDIQLMDIM